jgi:hypothetical protein
VSLNARVETCLSAEKADDIHPRVLPRRRSQAAVFFIGFKHELKANAHCPQCLGHTIDKYLALLGVGGISVPPGKPG